LVSELLTSVPVCTSDHSSLRFVLIAEIITSEGSPNAALTKLLWPKTNWHDFAIYLYSKNWQLLLSTCKNANDSWDLFSDIINCGIKLFVPVGLVRRQARTTKCHSKVIRMLQIKRRKFWKLMQIKPTPLRKSKYKQITSQLKDVVLHVALNKEKSILGSGNLCQFYKHVNARMAYKSEVVPLKDWIGHLTTTDTENAELLNDSFIAVGTVDNGIFPQYLTASKKYLIDNVYFDSSLLRVCISKLNCNSSARPDSFPPMSFKHLLNELTEPLVVLFRVFMKLGEVSAQWKTANVTPIFKKGASSDPLNSDQFLSHVSVANFLSLELNFTF